MVILLVLLSIFAITPIVSSTEFNSKSIENLDNKKMTVTGITASVAVVASGLALIPGDETTPLANQILRIIIKIKLMMQKPFVLFRLENYFKKLYSGSNTYYITTNNKSAVFI